MANERGSSLVTTFFVRVLKRKQIVGFENSMVPNCRVCRAGLEQEVFKAFGELVTAGQANPAKLHAKKFNLSRRISSFVGPTPGHRRADKAFVAPLWWR